MATSSMRAASASVATAATSLRVRPFTAAVAPKQRPAVRARAAAVDEELDFSFSFSDARKNNEYSTNEVEAAIRFFQDGEGSHPAFDADFVTNTLGTEDASFFDDVDNEEGYFDEYVVAGIPEAAPKKRGRARNQGGAQDEGDDVEQAKALDKVKALEDRMVLEAAIEEEFGDAGRADGAATASDGKGVWEWLTDLESTDAQGLEVPRKVAQTTAGVLVTDTSVTSDIALAKPELFEDTQVPTYLELFSADDVNEEVLEAVNESDDAAGVSGSSLTDADLARVDALLAAELPTLDLSSLGMLPSGPSVPRLDDSMSELSSQVVDRYIEQLRAVGVQSAGAPEADVKAALGADEPLTLEGDEPALDEASRKELSQLLAAKEPQLPALSFDLQAEAAAVEDMTGEPHDDEDVGLERELRQLAAIDPLTEESLPDAAVLEGLEGYLVAAEDYVAQEEARKASIAAAVARGELSADVLADELEGLPDAEDETVRELTLAADEELDNPSLDMSQFEEDDGENWVERIIELTRVTKVVKGGKIMGFRCVAIVGNQNGLVGVGCQAGREVAVAVKRTLVDAKRNVVRVPLVGAGTVPHRMEAKFHAARCVVVPASDGTGVIAGGSIRSVLELAGVKNVLAKRLGSRSALNSARATVRALQQMQSLPEVSKARGVPMEQLLLPQ